mmetsp:Transcript_28082/g.24810  ORF Transcript_28082/g.24810 Transcript_28082/m.24810 type:complete len:227 (-) Transcript_28082:101-781(-)
MDTSRPALLKFVEMFNNLVMFVEVLVENGTFMGLLTEEFILGSLKHSQGFLGLDDIHLFKGFNQKGLGFVVTRDNLVSLEACLLSIGSILIPADESLATVGEDSSVLVGEVSEVSGESVLINMDVHTFVVDHGPLSVVSINALSTIFVAELILEGLSSRKFVSLGEVRLGGIVRPFVTTAVLEGVGDSFWFFDHKCPCSDSMMLKAMNWKISLDDAWEHHQQADQA